MNAITKIRKALELMPSTPYSNGIGSNTKVFYNRKSITYSLGYANEHQNLTFEEAKRKILFRVEETEIEAQIEAIFNS